MAHGKNTDTFLLKIGPSEKILKMQQPQLQPTHTCLFIRNLPSSACQTRQKLDTMYSGKNQLYFFILFMLLLENVNFYFLSTNNQSVFRGRNTLLYTNTFGISVHVLHNKSKTGLTLLFYLMHEKIKTNRSAEYHSTKRVIPIWWVWYSKYLKVCSHPLFLFVPHHSKVLPVSVECYFPQENIWSIYICKATSPDTQRLYCSQWEAMMPPFQYELIS